MRGFGIGALLLALLPAGMLVAQHQTPALSSGVPAAPDNTVIGDAARGKVVFERQGCLDCHRVNGNGSRLGPGLSDIGAIRRPASLAASIVDPNAEVLPQNRFVRVVTKDGATITGRLLNQDSFLVLLMDPQQRLRSFSKSDLRECTVLKDSQMPSYKGKLSREELADLVGYLVSLKGKQ